MTTIFKIGWRDLVKGSIIVVLVAFLTGFKALLEQNGFNFSMDDLKEVGSTSVIAFVGYLLKNFLTDEDDKFMGAV